MTVYPAYDPTSLIAGDTDLIARPITVVGGSTVNGVTPLPRGTVLGPVTASGKYIPSVAGATGGSGLPVAILADTVDPSAGDVLCAAYFAGEFADVKLTFDVSWTSATLQAALEAADSQIYIRPLNTLG
jgi:hypothetical protein